MTEPRENTGVLLPWSVIAWLLGIVEGATFATCITLLAVDSRRFGIALLGVFGAIVASALTVAWAESNGPHSR